MSTSVEDLAGGYHFSFKVVICGDSGVGKTTLLDSEGTSAYSRGGNSDNTVGINFRIKFYFSHKKNPDNIICRGFKLYFIFVFLF